MSADGTIQEVIDLVTSEMAQKPLSNTVDTVKTGDTSNEVTGIATTFLATSSVIRQAAQAGANLIITHEPTFYSHEDATDWLVNDPVYGAKRQLIDEHRIVVWRLHDYIHLYRVTDGIVAGLVRTLDWDAYADPQRPFLCTIPPLSLGALVTTLKERLGIDTVRVVGDATMTCRRIGLLVGSSGVQAHLAVLRDLDADVVVCGEVHEWETAEYVRDALEVGQAKALVVVGHANSEEAGMSWFADWLRQRVPDVPITHIPAGNPLRTI